MNPEVNSVLLGTLQSRLQKIYEINSPHHIKDFLTTDPAIAQLFIKQESTLPGSEHLFVAQEGQDLAVSLYLDHKLVQRLREDSPSQTLHEGNLHDFWIALEGVSHFLYLTWRAHHDRPVSQLELELQAEIDKFVTTISLLNEQGRGDDYKKLWEKLFKLVAFDEKRDREDIQRYHLANIYASNYCQHLINTHDVDIESKSMLNELRRFYRLNEHSKIQYINQSATKNLTRI